MITTYPEITIYDGVQMLTVAKDFHIFFSSGRQFRAVQKIEECYAAQQAASVLDDFDVWSAEFDPTTREWLICLDFITVLLSNLKGIDLLRVCYVDKEKFDIVKQFIGSVPSVLSTSFVHSIDCAKLQENFEKWFCVRQDNDSPAGIALWGFHEAYLFGPTSASCTDAETLSTQYTISWETPVNDAIRQSVQKYWVATPNVHKSLPNVIARVLLLLYGKFSMKHEKWLAEAIAENCGGCDDAIAEVSGGADYES